jgi:hypothetical protein
MVDESQLKKFVEQLHSAHGDNLSCVLLYGSAATGQEGIINSDYNLLVALKRISPDDLKRAQPSMSRWREMGNPLPVFFTERELTAAVDVFPIEFNQMRRSRKVLYGNDPFTNLHISNQNLRHQIEYELRTSLLRLRRLYIPASVSSEKLSTLMVESLSTFATLFGSILMLHNEELPVDKHQSVRDGARLMELKEEVFERVFSLSTRGVKSLKQEEATTLFAEYMDEIEKAIEKVDSL